MSTIFQDISIFSSNSTQFPRAFFAWKVAETMKNSHLSGRLVKMTAMKWAKWSFIHIINIKKATVFNFLRVFFARDFFTVFLRLKIFSYLMWSYNLLFIFLNFNSFKQF